MLVSPHAHSESPLTGSTLASLVKRAKELGREYYAHTDTGHLGSLFKAYNAAKKEKLKFIPGLEIYFKDFNCPILMNSKAARSKYFTVTIYCKNKSAYQALAEMASRESFSTIQINEEKQQLWTWADLEEISKYDVDLVLGGVHCMVGKTMLAGEPDLAVRIYEKLKNIFKHNLYVAILAEPWMKKWNNVIEIKYEDGTVDSLLSSDYVNTEKARKIKAMDLVDNSRHTIILSKISNNTYNEVNKRIQSVTLHKGFLPLPGGDVTLRVNELLYNLAKGTNKVLVTDYAYYANKEDKIVQTMRLEGNNKLHANLHMKTGQEVFDYLTQIMKIDNSQANYIIGMNAVWASQYDSFELKYDWRLAEVDGEPMRLAMQIIKENGRMQWNNPIYVNRLREELAVIAKNPKKDLTPYFLPIRDVLNEYTRNGLLVGPGRGSAGGSLFCYLLGITQINPFKYDLPFSRFFSMARINTNKLPDIDVDLEGRELLVGNDGKSGYLYGRWGDKAAQISTRTTIRLKSAIKDTNRYFNGKVEQYIDTLSKGLPAPPQGVSDHAFVFGFEDEDENHIPGLIEQSEDLRKYAESRPKEWEIVSKAMGLTRAFSQHASAFVLSDIPIKDIVPTKEGHITQYEAKECEAAGLIKYDFLVVKQLKDIRICLELINKKNDNSMSVGHFNHKGEFSYIWDLPEDPEVFRSVWNGQTETCFQINTRSMIPFVKEILPQNIMDLATILALVRPGPLDFVDPNTGRNMTEEYVLRRRGESSPDIKELGDLLPETYGVITYQEQLNKIAVNLAGFSAEEAELLRENMAKKKKVELMRMKPQFIAGAIKKLSQETSEKIWEQMETFGRYGFSIIHAVEYAHITYACMFLKHYYPLEWWAAILTNADEQEITGKFWPYVKDKVSPPDINISSDIMEVDYKNNKIRSKLGIIRGMGDKTIEPLVNNRPYEDIQEFVNKEVAGPSLAHKLIHVGVLDSLFPAKTNLLEKLKMYEDAVETKKFTDKINKAKAENKKTRLIAPKQGVIPSEYINIHPLRDAAMKKAVLPSMPIDLYDLGSKYSKALADYTERPSVMSTRGYKTLLINGEKLRKLDEVPGELVSDDLYVAATCFVVEAKEFSFSKGTKRALKMILDSDGYVSEKVLWPDYETQQLMYPESLKKGSIATVFFRKRTGKKDMNITGIVVES